MRLVGWVVHGGDLWTVGYSTTFMEETCAVELVT